MPTTRRPLLHIARDAVLGLTISAAVLGVAEVALRLSGFQYQPLGPVGFNSRGPNRFHPYWFWEPRPGDPVRRCPEERINAAGFRGPQRPVERDPARLRIVTLGDSSTFGVKVCYRQTYSARLEEAIPGSEVLNFGVIGYSAFQGEKLLEGRVLEYQPDVVLLAFGAIAVGGGLVTRARSSAPTLATPRAGCQPRQGGARRLTGLRRAWDRASGAMRPSHRANSRATLPAIRRPTWPARLAPLASRRCRAGSGKGAHDRAR